MKDYKQLIKELPSNTIVCAVGEFNPPTVGHELLVKTVKKLAEQKRSAHVIYTSPSKNSLIQEDKKAHYLNIMFPKTQFKSINECNLQEVVTELQKRYKKVILVVGTDQITEMRKLQNVELIPVDKDPEADNAKMKQFASKGIYEEFKKKLPSTIRDIDGKRLMNEMRAGLGLEPIKEQVVFVKDKLREKYFRGEIFNEGDIVESNGEMYTIVKRGSNHLLLKEASGNLVSKWIQDVKPTEEKEMNESSKLTEAVIQPNGTDKIDTKTSEPMNTNGKTSEAKTKKGVITFYNYTKAQKIKEQSHAMADKKKDNESDQDYENQIKVTDVDRSEVGHTLVHAGGQDNLRRRKVKYHLGESSAHDAGHKDRWYHRKPNSGHPVGSQEHKDYMDAYTGKHKQKLTGFKTFDKSGKEVVKEASALEKFRAAAAEREKKHDAIEAKRKADAAQGKENMSGAIDRLDKQLNKESAMRDLPNNDRMDKTGIALNPFRKEKTAADIARINKAKQAEKNQKGGLYKPQSPSQRKATVNDLMKLVNHLGESDTKELTGQELAKMIQQKGMTAYDKESGHENTAQHIATNPEHTSKQKKLAQSFIARMQGVAENVTADKASKETAKANLMAKHAKEKESLADKHTREKESLSEAAPFKSKEDAVKYAKEKVKTHRDNLDGIEIHAHSGGFDVNHTSNSSGRNSLQKIGAKHVGTVYKEEVELEEAKKKPLVGVVATAKPFDPFFEDNEYDQTVDVATPNTAIETSEEDDMDDDEIDAMLGKLSDDEIMDEYDEEDLAVVDEETGEEIPKSAEEAVLDEQAIMEVLSRVERMKAKFRIRRTAAKRERATKIALKRYSNTETINKRARRLAIKLIKQRMLRGRDPSKISVGEKERIERALEQRKAIIGRIATRLTPRIRKVEKARMSHSKYTQSNQPNVF